MNSKIDHQSILALASVGIYLTDKRLEECQQLAKDYIKSWSNKTDHAFPNLDSICSLTLVMNGVTYSFKVTLCGPNEYAIINGEHFSIFKVSKKQNQVYKILWKSVKFNVNISRNGNSYQAIIDYSKTINIQKIENFFHKCVEIPCTFDDQPSDDKLNTILENSLSKLNNILNGYILPEPFFTLNLSKELEIMFTVLRDPLLPSLEFQNLLDKNHSSLPNCVLNDLEQIIAQYNSNYSSVFSRFPSNKILSLINKYLDNIADQSTKYNMMIIFRPILELAQMYSDGIRGNAKHIIDNLLEEYRKVEIKFQNEDDLVNLNIFNKSLSVTDVFSHNYLREKNKLILFLIECLEKYLPGLIMDLKPTIHKLLDSLNGKMYSQVVSKLREVLITGQIPSYEVRRNEIEAVFLNSINRYSNSLSTCRLESLIYSNSEMFDIISDFFYHKMVDLRKCALEVYIRRAYMAYQINSFRQSQLPSGHLCVVFLFERLLSNKDKNMPNLKRSNSFVTLNNSPNHNFNIRKFSQQKRITGKVSPFYFDKDDIPEVTTNDFLNEYNLLDDKIWTSKIHDNDTDSAISIGAHSLSEISATVSDQIDFDSIGEQFQNLNHHSPSVHSLEELPMINKTSDISLDSLGSNKWKRRMSIFSNQLPPSYYEDFLGNLHMGIMVIFDTLDDFDRNINCFTEILSNGELSNYSDYLEYDYLDGSIPSSVYKVVINVALCDSDLTVKLDEDIAKIFYLMCKKHSLFLNEINVSRITFLLQSTDRSLRYFTFRANDNFQEDFKVRQIDPALSFQLEINRLRNYHLERLPVLNRRMYVYLGRAKSITLIPSSEYRMFVRCIIHHNDINLSTTTIDYMAKEAEKSLIEAIDAFDIAWTDTRVNLTSSNHIFFYFHSILCLNKIEELESVVRKMILKYGHRLWNLHITQAELKLSVKLNNDCFSTIPVRLWVHNEGGKSLDIFIYREEFNINTDQKVLMSWSPAKDGRYHGVPVNFFYSI